MAVDAQPRLRTERQGLRAPTAEERPVETTPPPRRRRWLSRLSLPILAVNLSALFLLGVGLFYLDEYEKGLVIAEIEAMRAQGKIIAGAVGEIAVEGGTTDVQTLRPELARQLIRRLVDPMQTRVRLFRQDGELVADSRMLGGPGAPVRTTRPTSALMRRATCIMRRASSVFGYAAAGA